MMARQVLEIVRKYTADTKQWQSALQNIDRNSAKTAKSMQRLEQRTQGLEKSMKGVAVAGKAFGVALAGAFSIQAIGGSIRQITDQMDSLSNAAERVGVSAASIQTLRAEAQKVGLSVSGVDTALQRFSRRIGEARQGTGQLAGVFKQYGISLQNVNGTQKSVNQLLNEFQKVMTGITDPSERLRVAMAGFDTDGVKLAQTLISLGRPLDEVNQLMEQQGRIVGDDVRQAYADFAVVQAEFNQRLDVLRAQILLPLVERLNDLLDLFNRMYAPIRRAANAVKEFVEQHKYLKAAVDGLLNPYRALIDLVDKYTGKQKEASGYSFDAAGKMTIDIGGGGVPEMPAVPPPADPAAVKGTVDQIDRIAKALSLSKKGAENLRKMFPAIAQAARETGVDITILLGKIKRESSFTNFKATGSSARGPSQIIKSTAKYLANKYGFSYEALREGTDEWMQNIRAGAAYLREQMQGAENEVVGLAKYFLGPGTVAQRGIDVTAGNNGGLTGRGYASNILKEANKVRAVMGDYGGGYDLAAESVRKLTEAERAQQERVNEGLAIYQNTRVAAEKYVETLSRLRELLAAGALPGGEETFIRAVEQAAEAYNRATNGAAEFGAGLNNLANQSASLGQQIGDNLQGAFGSWIDSAVEGTFRLRDALRELAKDIAKMALKFAANQLFSSFLGGAGGGGGLLGNLLGSLFAKGAAFPQLALPQGVYTQPTYFPMPQGGPLKRYARGGVLGEAGAEAILPLRRLPSGRLGVEGGGTEVVINNYSGEAVSRRNRQLGDKEIIEIAIGQMEERVARGGNSTSRSMQQAFGLRRGR